jgi:hypothetical protein
MESRPGADSTPNNPTSSIEKSVNVPHPSLETESPKFKAPSEQTPEVKTRIKDVRRGILKIFGVSDEENQNPQQQEEEIDLQKYIEEVKRIRVEAAEKYLPEGDPLRIKMIEYFSERPEVDQELRNYLSNLGDEEAMQDYIENLKRGTEDSEKYIADMEHTFEINSVYSSRRNLGKAPRLATDQEYEMGVYTDYLESQVRDAVPALWEKGYRTFQSGYGEKDIVRQYIDFSNEDITIPEDLEQYLEEKGVAITMSNEDDRTTLSLRPRSGKSLRLSEWKEIWDTVAEMLPEVDPKTAREIPPYSDATNFRNAQDALRLKNGSNNT